MHFDVNKLIEVMTLDWLVEPSLQEDTLGQYSLRVETADGRSPHMDSFMPNDSQQDNSERIP